MVDYKGAACEKPKDSGLQRMEEENQGSNRLCLHGLKRGVLVNGVSCDMFVGCALRCLSLLLENQVTVPSTWLTVRAVME